MVNGDFAFKTCQGGGESYKVACYRFDGAAPQAVNVLLFTSQGNVLTLRVVV